MSGLPGAGAKRRFAATTAAVAAGAALVAAPARAQVPAPPLPSPIAVDLPVASVPLQAQRLDRRRLTAVVELAGRAAPDMQLTLTGACGGLSCDAMTYTDHAGRWRTRMRLTTPRARRAVTVRVAYWPGLYAQPRARVRVALRRSALAAPAAPPVPPAAVGGSAGRPPSGARPALVVVGDSLAIGTAGSLAADLPDFDVRTDARVGRPLAEGMDVLAGTTLPWQLDGRRTILAFSLFTNDDPVDAPRSRLRCAPPSPASARAAARSGRRSPAGAARHELSAGQRAPASARGGSAARRAPARRAVGRGGRPPPPLEDARPRPHDRGRHVRARPDVRERRARLRRVAAYLATAATTARRSRRTETHVHGPRRARRQS